MRANIVPNTKADHSPDSRHLLREDILQQLFAWTFSPEQQAIAVEKANETIRDIIKMLPEIDVDIARIAPERPLADINKVDLAVLRLILWEARTKNTPKKVLVDEGIELAKSFGADQSAKFVNAALARLLLDEMPAEITPSQI